MRKVTIEIKLDPDCVSVGDVERKLGLKADQLDREFGLRAMRPEQGFYAIRVDSDVAARLLGEDRPRRRGSSKRANDVRVGLVH